jgi:hypothetical protein
VGKLPSSAVTWAAAATQDILSFVYLDMCAAVNVPRDKRLLLMMRAAEPTVIDGVSCEGPSLVLSV